MGGRATGQVAKVIRNKSITFGLTGTVRPNNVLQYTDLPEIPGGANLDKWLTTELIPVLKKALTDAQTVEVDKGLVDLNGMMILALPERVYYVGADFSWFRSEDGNYAVGSGAPYALGALYAGSTVKQAVEAALHYDIYSSGPIKVTRV